MIDARVAQTRNRLTEAILELAATMPVHKISVAAVARRAGINRATFYDHYRSPSDLLADTLRAEFDAMRRRYLELHDTSASPAEALRTGLHRLLLYIESRRAVYERTLGGTPDPDVTRILSDAFSAACFGVLQETVDPPLPRDRARVIAAFAANGAVASIGTWLTEPAVSRDELINVLVDSFPRWWR